MKNNCYWIVNGPIFFFHQVSFYNTNLGLQEVGLWIHPPIIVDEGTSRSFDCPKIYFFSANTYFIMFNYTFSES